MVSFNEIKGENISESTIGLPTSSAQMLTCNIEASRPLPCVVILIHGVNDIGEAFENQDEMICAGLNKRLGRNDLKPNKWQLMNTDADDYSPNIRMLTEWEEKVEDKNNPSNETKTVKCRGYSPVIPFTWGYRPVDEETYKEEQLAYYNRLKDANITDPELPYDSFWIDRDCYLNSGTVHFNKLNCDKFGNWIDYKYQRNGGPFANATSCIPDMYGPGMAGILAYWGNILTPKGSKSYDNPHRIYFAFAAHRLANLIKTIRKDTQGQDIPINIVAHSQGTIITMLANLLLAQEKEKTLPADCIILAHSPYAFEPSTFEMLTKDLYMGLQSQYGREQTFINFVELMHKIQSDRRKNFFDIEKMIEAGVINTEVNPNEIYVQSDGSIKHYDRLGKDASLFYRDNYGKVYHYFSPNDHVVSLLNVQGMGWQGIPDHIFKQCKTENLKQRIFSHGHIVGNDTKNGKIKVPIILLEVKEKDYPNYISVADYNQRLEYMNYYGEEVEASVVLLPEQLEKLIKEPLFKNRKGFFSNGFYFNSGRAFYVRYIPTNEEIGRDYPELFYQKISSKQLDTVCEDYEKNQSIEEKLVKRKAAAKVKCNDVSTGDIKTAPYIFTERLINGEPVPETMIYTVDEPGEKTKLSRVIHYNDIYNSDNIFREKLEKKIYFKHINRPDYIPPQKVDMYEVKSLTISDETQLKKLEAEHPEWDRGIKSVQYVVCEPDRILVSYRIPQQELDIMIRNLVDDEEETSSHHSGITNSREAPAKIMAYDLAIGVVQGITPTCQTTLNEWRRRADWRHPQNSDPETVQYALHGVLPKPLKRAMNYPEKHMPNKDLVVNNFHRFFIIDQINDGLWKDKYSKLTNPPQWIHPDPDLKGISNVDD